MIQYKIEGLRVSNILWTYFAAGFSHLEPLCGSQQRPRSLKEKKREATSRVLQEVDSFNLVSL